MDVALLLLEAEESGQSEKTEQAPWEVVVVFPLHRLRISGVGGSGGGFVLGESGRGLTPAPAQAASSVQNCASISSC